MRIANLEFQRRQAENFSDSGRVFDSARKKKYSDN
jgi:hypothetical protein